MGWGPSMPSEQWGRNLAREAPRSFIHVLLAMALCLETGSHPVQGLLKGEGTGP